MLRATFVASYKQFGYTLKMKKLLKVSMFYTGEPDENQNCFISKLDKMSGNP